MERIAFDDCHVHLLLSGYQTKSYIDVPKNKFFQVPGLELFHAFVEIIIIRIVFILNLLFIIRENRDIIHDQGDTYCLWDVL